MVRRTNMYYVYILECADPSSHYSPQGLRPAIIKKTKALTNPLG